MITEDYVSFKIAKLLKKKGFNEPCEENPHKKMAFYLANPKKDSISASEINATLNLKRNNHENYRTEGKSL